MLFDSLPTDFNKQFDVVACFIEYDGKFLMLLRRANKPNGNTWGLPAGKVDEGETLNAAMAREITEETGIIASTYDFTYHSVVPVRHDSIDFEYHMYGLELPTQPEVIVRTQEHQSHDWFTPENSLRLPLVPDQGECTRRYFSI